jgi:hypothetical protein
VIVKQLSKFFFAASVVPVDGRLHFDWAMAGLDPGLEGLNGGRLRSARLRKEATRLSESVGVEAASYGAE